MIDNLSLVVILNWLVMVTRRALKFTANQIHIFIGIFWSDLLSQEVCLIAVVFGAIVRRAHLYLCSMAIRHELIVVNRYSEFLWMRFILVLWWILNWVLLPCLLISSHLSFLHTSNQLVSISSLVYYDFSISFRALQLLIRRHPLVWTRKVLGFREVPDVLNQVVNSEKFGVIQLGERQFIRTLLLSLNLEWLVQTLDLNFGQCLFFNGEMICNVWIIVIFVLDSTLFSFKHAETFIVLQKIHCFSFWS